MNYKAQINVIENRRWSLSVYERDERVNEPALVTNRSFLYPLLWVEDIEKELKTMGYVVDPKDLAEEVFGQPILRTTSYVVDVTPV